MNVTWHAEHIDFLRRLDLLEQQLAWFRAGERPDYDLMLEILHYLRRFPDEIHHPREDAAFARLARKLPGMELVFARLQQEHRVIARAGQELLELLEAALDGAIVPREAIEAAAATYLLYYRNHIATEERDVLPQAARVLTAEDWAEVAALRAALPARSLRDVSGTPAPGSSNA